MDKQSPHQLLRVPAATRDNLDFCEATPGALRQWIANLPRANLGETSRRLYEALTVLNELQIGRELRLQMLELLRPEIYEVCRNLEQQFLGQAVALDQQARQVASLCQSMQSHLAAGYKLVVIAEIDESTGKPGPSLALALQRAIRSLYAALIGASQLYSPVPEGSWLELHLLYEIARMNNIERQAIADGLAEQTGSLSVEQSYLAALLLGCARCNQLRQRSIAQLGRMLETWSILAHLQAATDPSSLFVVTPPIDGAPRYRSLVPAAALPGWLGIDAHALVEAIKEHLQLPVESRHLSPLPAADQVDPDLLLHLYSAWGGMTCRSFPRSPAEGTLNLCVGMSAVHYFLAGQREFEEVVKHGETHRQASFDRSITGSDVWAGAFDARDDVTKERKLERIDFRSGTRDEKAPDETRTSYPTFDFSIVDQSVDGYCLAITGEVPAQLQVGEVVALRESAEREWLPAVIRWIRQQTSGEIQMGIQLMGRQAHPCALRLIVKEKQNSQYLRTLLLPESTTLNQPATLIAPRLPFKEGHKVSILDNQYEYRALLTRRQGGTASFNQFEYQSLEMDAQAKPFTTMRDQPSQGTEGFDSIWKSL